jgi:hypothetical protein
VRRALRLLVRLFPAAFREEFAAGMTEQIEQDLQRARARGRVAALWCALATAFDLALAAVAERWNPTWVSAKTPRSEEKGMRPTGQRWARDLRHALRSLRRSPGFTAVTVGTLGLAIGVNAGMFSVVQTVLLNPLPYSNVDRLVHIGAAAPGSGFPDEFGVAAEFLVHYRERSRLLEEVSTYNSFTATLRTPDRVERIRMSWPTSSLFGTLGAQPILGRLPVPADEDRVAVISHELWSSWFGRDAAVIGRSYEIGGASRTIVGVMGPDFKFPNDGTLLWISNDVRPAGIEPGRFGPRSSPA